MVHHIHPRRRATTAFLPAIAFASALMAMSPVWAETGEPAWNPQSSERLVKLPAQYLEKSLDNDFARSELGLAIRDADAGAGLKLQTLADLRSAIELADGEVRTELMHQFLAEKKAYIDLMSRQHELGRRHLVMRQRLYEQVLDRLGREEENLSPARAELIERQTAARERFSSSFADVDLKLLDSVAVAESQYSREYARVQGVVESLVRAIEDHPMNEGPEMDGQEMTKASYVRQLVANTEAQLAILDQEDKALGYMGKLIALDAAALAEQVTIASIGTDDLDQPKGILDAVEFFVAN